MKRNTKIVLAIVIYIGSISILLCFFWFHNPFRHSGSPSADPKETIEGFVAAYNADDIVSMLDYITVDKREFIQGILNAAEDYSDKNITAALQVMPIVSKFAKYTNQEDLFPDIKVEIGDAKKQGRDCKVAITASAESVNIISIGFLVNLKYDSQNQVWLIDSAQLDE